MERHVESQSEGRTGGGPLLLVVAWLWVGVPLAWGVLQTLRTSLALFR